jgi:hypothetical protein
MRLSLDNLPPLAAKTNDERNLVHRTKVSSEIFA